MNTIFKYLFYFYLLVYGDFMYTKCTIIIFFSRYCINCIPVILYVINISNGRQTFKNNNAYYYKWTINFVFRKYKQKMYIITITRDREVYAFIYFYLLIQIKLLDTDSKIILNLHNFTYFMHVVLFFFFVKLYNNKIDAFHTIYIIISYIFWFTAWQNYTD